MKRKRESTVRTRKLKLKTQCLVSSKELDTKLGKSPVMMTQTASNDWNKDHVPTAYSVSDAKHRTSQM